MNLFLMLVATSQSNLNVEYPITVWLVAMLWALIDFGKAWLRLGN